MAMHPPHLKPYYFNQTETSKWGIQLTLVWRRDVSLRRRYIYVLPVLVVDIAVEPLPAWRRESVLHPVDSILNDSLPTRVKLGQHLVVNISFGLNCRLHILMSFLTNGSQRRRYIVGDHFQRRELIGCGLAPKIETNG
jgi:hypothetical protein